MSSLEKKSNPYEILLRFDEKTGKLKGAHQQRINLLLEDGVIIHATLGDAVPVDLADFAASDLMSQAMEAALQGNADLQSQLADALQANDALRAEIMKANRTIEGLRSQMDDIQKQTDARASDNLEDQTVAA